ncbi:MAG TPA: hypothetical protein VK815_09110 [Candidatus Acidoferrales bacterium]|nr:hypothetical protein [Candidatus Acidoferrales bacterium]
MPPQSTARRRIKNVLLVIFYAGMLLVMAAMLKPDTFTFLMLQADGILHAGTWNDDPKNWRRAFGEDAPATVKVIHSKYWRSNHFTDEHICHFEVQATPEWKAAFLKKHGLVPVPPPTTSSLRTNNHSDYIPKWFAPGPADDYEVWAQADGFSSVWINKTTGHIFFYDEQI